MLTALLCQKLLVSPHCKEQIAECIYIHICLTLSQCFKTFVTHINDGKYRVSNGGSHLTAYLPKEQGETE